MNDFYKLVKSIQLDCIFCGRETRSDADHRYFVCDFDSKDHKYEINFEINNIISFMYITVVDLETQLKYRLVYSSPNFSVTNIKILDKYSCIDSFDIKGFQFYSTNKQTIINNIKKYLLLK